jgi:hypothetical protein
VIRADHRRIQPRACKRARDEAVLVYGERNDLEPRGTERLPPPAVPRILDADA